jgi:hypothetical protein
MGLRSQEKNSDDANADDENAEENDADAVKNADVGIFDGILAWPAQSAISIFK